MKEKVDRLTRVNILLKRELGNLFERYLVLPRGMLLSVVEIRSSVDLRNATVLVSLFGGSPEDRRAAFQELKKRRPDFQKAIAHTLAFKNTPVLNFKLDDRMERGDRVFEMLDHGDLDASAKADTDGEKK